MSNNLELDNLDRALLSLVQKDNRRSAESLGASVGLSTAAVQRRLRRLRDTKVITADVALVDRSKIGYPLQFLVHVQLERESSDSIQRFRKAASQENCVQHIYYVTGQFDFVLLMIARDMPHFEAVADELFLQSEDIKAFTTSVVMGESQQSCLVPLA